NLGWTFDGYETFSLILVVGIALRDLLDPSQFGQIPAYAGTVIGITLLGWGIGGVIGGVLADYIGRRRTMIFAILAYSLTTGLSAFAWDWVSFALLRFLVGIAIGSEWSTGASITAEVWPDNARGRGAGLMQCGLGIGFFLASFTWLFVSGYGPGAWRIMFLIGVIPAFFTLWLRTGIPESQKWEQSNEKRKSAKARKKSGAVLSDEDHALTRFTFADLFADPEIRKRTIIVFLMSLTTTVAWWGISTWVPPFIAAAAGKAGLPPQTWASYAGMSYNIGAICGSIGRRPTCIFCCWARRSTASSRSGNIRGCRCGGRNCSRRACAQRAWRSPSTARVSLPSWDRCSRARSSPSSVASAMWPWRSCSSTSWASSWCRSCRRPRVSRYQSNDGLTSLQNQRCGVLKRCAALFIGSSGAPAWPTMSL